MCRFGLAITLTFTLTLALPASDWPQYLGPHRDGHSPETALNWNWSKDGPPVAWTIDVGSGWAGPVVAGDRLILFHRVGDEEVVACLDPATGKEKWTSKYRTRYRDDFMFDDGPRATPLIAGERIFTLGANGDLHAWELATGKKLWHHNLLADYASPKGYFGIACSPVLAAGKLLINVGAKGAGIVAFDPVTGKEAWKATDDAASYSSPMVAEVGGKTLVIFLTRNGLVAVEPEAGKVRFTFPWRPRIDASVNAATPLVWKDEIFLTVSYNTGGVLLRAKGDELEEVWSNDRSLSCHYNTPVRVGDYLYGVHGRQEGVAQLRCVEWKTGAVKWTVPRFGTATLIAVDGGLLALTEGGDLVRFDASPDGFKERGRAKVLGTPTRAAPALAGGRLFARDGSKLVCVKLKTD
jgi:outer membrane protein assembly factor BamB